MTGTGHDVAVVGGGPAGCAVAVFTARYGLDTVIFDRGRSSLWQCAHLENYPGFPAGVDVETFYDLLHDHVHEAGGTVVPDFVESVTRREDGDGFRVELQAGEPVTADRVVAATRYGGEYLRPLDDGATFETGDQEGGDLGDDSGRFDRSITAEDGSTPIQGLFVASPSEAADRQAIVAAGRGARVGLAVVEAVRRDRGYPGAVAAHYDWVRRGADLDEEWTDRDRWRTWFDERCPDRTDLDAERRVELREREIDRRLATYVEEAELTDRARTAQVRLLEHLDDDLVCRRADEIEGDVSTSGVN